mgnify:FL=1
MVITVTFLVAKNAYLNYIKTKLSLAKVKIMSIIQVNMHEAKSQLSYLSERVLAGDKVIIAKAGKPCIELLPHVQTQPVRQAGRLKGKIVIPDDFDSTANDIIDSFYGSQL